MPSMIIGIVWRVKGRMVKRVFTCVDKLLLYACLYRVLGAHVQNCTNSVQNDTFV